MRLLIALPSSNPGGADRTYLAPIVPAAVAAGWEVHAACADRPALQPLVEQLERDGATHHRCDLAESHRTGLGHVLQQRRFRRNTASLLQRVHPDVVLLPIPWASYGVGIMKACRSHGVPAATVFQLVRRGWPPGWRRREFRRLLATAGRPVAVSEDNRRIIAEMYGIPAEEITLIRNGIDPGPGSSPSRRCSIRDRIRTELEVGARRLVLVTARLAPQKGLGDLVEAMPMVIDRHPDVLFAFAGDGPDRDELSDLAHRLEVQHHLRFLGRRDDVPDLLIAADAFVLPSRFEGSPFALVEAMHAGLPIVTTEASGIPEVIRHEKDGLVVPTAAPEALAIAIQSLLADPDFAADLARHATRRAEAFTGRRMATETLGLLEAIATDAIHAPGIEITSPKAPSTDEAKARPPR